MNNNYCGCDNCKPVYPEDIPDVNDAPYRGSFNQLLQANIGRMVTIEYMAGTSESRSHTGIIEAVATKWVSLRNPCNNTRQVGDVFAIRFITFLCD